MNKRNDNTLREVINELLETYRLKDKLNEQKLINQWERLMGKTIARYTKNISIRDKKLLIQVDSAPLRQELNLAKEKIREILNKEVGEEIIKEVVIHA